MYEEISGNRLKSEKMTPINHGPEIFVTGEKICSGISRLSIPQRVPQL